MLCRVPDSANPWYRQIASSGYCRARRGRHRGEGRPFRGRPSALTSAEVVEDGQAAALGEVERPPLEHDALLGRRARARQVAVNLEHAVDGRSALVYEADVEREDACGLVAVVRDPVGQSRPGQASAEVLPADEAGRDPDAVRDLAAAGMPVHEGAAAGRVTRAGLELAR